MAQRVGPGRGGEGATCGAEECPFLVEDGEEAGRRSGVEGVGVVLVRLGPVAAGVAQDADYGGGFDGDDERPVVLVPADALIEVGDAGADALFGVVEECGGKLLRVLAEEPAESGADIIDGCVRDGFGPPRESFNRFDP